MMHKINPGLFAQALTIPLMEEHAILTQVAGHNEDVLKVAPALVVVSRGRMHGMVRPGFAVTGHTW